MKKVIITTALLMAIITVSYSQDTIWTHTYEGIGNIVNACFSPDDSKILVSGSEKFLEVDPATGNAIDTMTNFGEIYSISKNKQYAVTYSYKIVDANNYNVIKDIGTIVRTQLNKYPGSFGFDDSLKLFGFATAYRVFPDYDSTLVFVDANTMNIKKIINGDKAQYSVENYNNIKISPDGKYFATLSHTISYPDGQTFIKKNLKLWSTDSFSVVKVLRSVDYKDYPNYDIKFSPDGKYLALATGFYLFIYNLITYNTIDTFYFGNLVTSFTFSKDSKYIFAEGGYQPIQKLDILKNTVISKSNYTYYYNYINFSNSEDKMVSGDSYLLVLYNSNSTTVKDPIKGENNIFPNPIKDNIYFKNNNISNLAYLDLYNSEGIYYKNIYNGYINENEILNLNLSDIPSGMYFIRLTNNNTNQTYKIIKEK